MRVAYVNPPPANVRVTPLSVCVKAMVDVPALTVRPVPLISHEEIVPVRVSDQVPVPMFRVFVELPLV